MRISGKKIGLINFAFLLFYVYNGSMRQINSLTLPTLDRITRYKSYGTQRHATSQQTQEEIQSEIAELREIAGHRLDALLEQMEDLKNMNAIYEQQRQKLDVDDIAQESFLVNEDLSATSRSIIAAPTLERTMQAQPEQLSIIRDIPPPVRSKASDPQASINLLDETSWKIVFNIGREKGTWMPKDWGISGDRLLFQCTVEFTKDSLQDRQYYDEFFHGHTDTKQLLVKDAFIIPRGVGVSSVGRRPLPVQPKGAYKVCRNQGPCETDIVRLYIELTDVVTLPDHNSDVYCPSGRIYATCGYFPIQSKLDPTKHSLRDKSQKDYNEALHEYERIQLQLDSDTRSFLKVDHLKLMKQSWDAKQHMDELAQKLRDARQREPEKDQLRLDVAQTIGLTREGGVCCKVHKGLALEYHILGKVEVGCMNDH